MIALEALFSPWISTGIQISAFQISKDKGLPAVSALATPILAICHI